MHFDFMIEGTSEIRHQRFFPRTPSCMMPCLHRFYWRVHFLVVSVIFNIRTALACLRQQNSASRSYLVQSVSRLRNRPHNNAAPTPSTTSPRARVRGSWPRAAHRGRPSLRRTGRGATARSPQLAPTERQPRLPWGRRSPPPRPPQPRPAGRHEWPRTRAGGCRAAMNGRAAGSPQHRLAGPAPG